MKKFVKKHYDEIQEIVSWVFFTMYIVCLCLLIEPLFLPIKYGFAVPENEFGDMVYDSIFCIISIVFVRFLEIGAECILSGFDED